MEIGARPELKDQDSSRTGACPFQVKVLGVRHGRDVEVMSLREERMTCQGLPYPIPKDP